ncbi:MAG: hypothetical protein K9J17_11305 [Flavobacteriales bacterium]|nr:hypothetical protein [Flavobacteriales bacterium]
MESWFENGVQSNISWTESGFPISCGYELVSEDSVKVTECYFENQQVYLAEDNIWKTLSNEVLSLDYDYRTRVFYENGTPKSRVIYVDGNLLVENWDRNGKPIE